MCISEETILEMDHGVAAISEIVAIELIRKDDVAENGAAPEPANDSEPGARPLADNSQQTV